MVNCWWVSMKRPTGHKGGHLALRAKTVFNVIWKCPGFLSHLGWIWPTLCLSLASLKCNSANHHESWRDLEQLTSEFWPILSFNVVDHKQMRRAMLYGDCVCILLLLLFFLIWPFGKLPFKCPKNSHKLQFFL